MKVNAPENRARRTTSRVCSKSSSVSPGKPTMMSVVMAASRHRLADPLDDAEVLRLPVGTPHRAQHRVGAGLQRHVQLRHHVRRLGHRRDDVVGELRGVRRGEPHPLQSLDLAARAQQLGERLPVAELHAVRVDVLAQQRHLADALADQRRGSRRGCRRAGGPSPCRAAPGRCRTCTCCCSRPRSTPTRRTPTRAWSAASTGTPRATRGSRPAPPPAPARARAGPAASRCCGCRRRRRPTAPSR